jgi:DNA polymerase elongation subunit (family B)
MKTIIDFYEENDKIQLVLKGNKKEIQTLDFDYYFYFKNSNWKKKEYDSFGESIISRSFLGGFQKNADIFGKIKCKYSEKTQKINEYSKKFSNFNTKTELSELFQHKHELCFGDKLSNDPNDFKIIKTNENAPDHFTHLNLYSIHVEIEESEIREPISNWHYKAHLFGYDYNEVCDEPTQKIKQIELRKFNLNDDTIENVIFKGKNELHIIEEFIKYFDEHADEIDFLICWKYDFALEYIKERYELLGGKVENFREYVYRSKKNRKIHVEKLEFDSPVQYVYLSVFYIYYHMGKNKCKGGYKERNISKFYFNKELTGNDLTISLFKNQHYFVWMRKNNRLFMTSFRTMVAAFSKRFLNYLVYYMKEDYLIPHYFNNSWDKEDRTGGTVITPNEIGTLRKNVKPLDFKCSYPNIIKEKNLCPTTMTFTKGFNLTEIPLKNKRNVNGEMKGDSFVYFVKRNEKVGELPKICHVFCEEREKLQNAMKKMDPKSADYAHLNIEQTQLKNFVNSIYGYSVYLCPEVAESIVYFGRLLLDELGKTLNQNGINTEAGDTDCRMVYEPNQEVKEKINQVCSEFCKNYAFIQISQEEKFDAIYFISKKNYYAIRNINGQIQYIRKGTDCERRDLSPFTKEVCTYLSSYIFEDVIDIPKINGKLKEMFSNIEPSKLEIDNYTIGKHTFLQKRMTQTEILKKETLKRMEKILKIIKVPLKNLEFLKNK